ncbi:MAG: tetratricopeptide repeat protein [Bacteroidota bacterium]
MKKNLTYILLFVFFIGAVGFIVMKYKKDTVKKETAVYQLQPRIGAQAQSEEWTTTQKAAEKLLTAIKKDPQDKKSLIALANLFIMESRVTGNYSYYDMAAMKYISDVLALEANNFEALTLKALVQLSQHHFADGLATAETARNINRYNAFVFGILVDANVEMGRYDSALSAAETMMSIRPDLRSYARASYLREIHGDYPGAIEAMKLAIEAGAPGDESTEWSRVQLGHLYENIGDLKNAAMQYTVAANERPGYPYPLAGLARVALAEKNYPKAIELYQQADALVNNNSFKEGLAEAYKMSGRNDEAKKIMDKAIAEMAESAKAALTDPNIGHYSDKELAEIYSRVGAYDKALEHALAEYNRRPNNIEVNETLAWAYFNKGDIAKAAQYIKVALKTNSQNPALLSHAGLIFLKAGDIAMAKKYLQDGLKNDPNIFSDLKRENAAALKQL